MFVHHPIKNRLSAALVFLVLGALALSCGKKTVYEGAHLSIEPKEADFGTIASNDPVAFHDLTLTLENQGKEELNIEDVELPEGFSYTIVPRNTLPSGAEASLKITFDQREFSGKVSETAHIVSNDSSQPRMPLALAANIVGNANAPVKGGATGPDIEFDHKTHIFGTITRNQTVEHSFPFKNVGTQVLKIQYIETACLCATAHATKTELEPGESAEIIAKLEAFKFPGNKPQKTLDVVSNDPDEPMVPLTVLARIIDAVELEPEEILLPNLQAGQPATAKALVIQDGSTDLEIREITSSSPMISVEKQPLQGERKGFELTITISPDMPEGPFEELLTIMTNYSDYTNVRQGKGGGTELYKDYRRLQLPVKGTVKGAISVVPASVNFGTVSPGESQQRTLVVSGDTSFTIKSASLADRGLRATFDPEVEETRHEITLRFQAEGPERNISDKLVISTSAGTLAAAVYATVKAKP